MYLLIKLSGNVLCIYNLIRDYLVFWILDFIQISNKYFNVHWDLKSTMYCVQSIIQAIINIIFIKHHRLYQTAAKTLHHCRNIKTLNLDCYHHNQNEFQAFTTFEREMNPKYRITNRLYISIFIQLFKIALE